MLKRVANRLAGEGQIMVDEKWHLDKRVPISIIVTLCIQTATIVWWAAGMNHQIQTHETRLNDLSAYDKAQDVRVELMQADRTTNLQRLSRVEQSLADIKEFMARIDYKLDKVTETTRK